MQRLLPILRLCPLLIKLRWSFLAPCEKSIFHIQSTSLHESESGLQWKHGAASGVENMEEDVDWRAADPRGGSTTTSIARYHHLPPTTVTTYGHIHRITKQIQIRKST